VSSRVGSPPTGSFSVIEPAALVVNESHPERNADVVLFLDTFAEARSADGGTLAGRSERPPRSQTGTSSAGTGWASSASAGSCDGWPRRPGGSSSTGSSRR
jgi:hypothetical protein